MLYNSRFHFHSHSRSHFHFHFHFHLQVFIFASNFNACFMIFLLGTNEMHEMFAFYNTAKMYQKRRQKQKPSVWHGRWVCACVCAKIHAVLAAGEAFRVGQNCAKGEGEMGSENKYVTGFQSNS